MTTFSSVPRAGGPAWHCHRPGVTPEPLPGGQLVALSRPEEVAAALDR